MFNFREYDRGRNMFHYPFGAPNDFSQRYISADIAFIINNPQYDLFMSADLMEASIGSRVLDMNE